jgi:hypothetical protein
MSDLYLLLTPVLAAGVLALVGFVGCQYLWQIPEIPPPPVLTKVVDFVVSPDNPPNSRNNFSGWVGMVIQPASDIKLLSLGRWCSPMNSQPHDVKVVDAATGEDIPGAIVAISLAGQQELTFVFVDLPAPIVLTGSQTYYLVSQEQAGGDAFLDFDITVTPSADFQVPSAVFAVETPTPPTMYQLHGAVGNCYGPVTAQY